VFFYFEDLQDSFKKNGVGGTFDNAPFYNTETGEQLGFYSDTAADLSSEDCVGSGAFSFGMDEPYVSQIAFQFTCFGEFNSITGGTGMYGCAKGFEEFIYDDGEIIESELNLCGEMCPYFPKPKPQPHPAPEPKKPEPKPQPKPEPKPQPAPKPEKPKPEPAPKPEKPKPEPKPQPEKPKKPDQGM